MKKTLISIGLILSGGFTFGAQVIPQDMILKSSYQYVATDPKLIGTTSPAYNFTDDDLNGVVSVSIFEDSKGNLIYEKISDNQYADIGQVNGFLSNPSKTEFVTLAGLLTPKVKAAIAFDSAEAGVRINAQSITWSCTAAGSDKLAIVYGGNNEAADVNTMSATYNGTSMTKIDRGRLPSGGAGNMAVFYLINPSSGNCVVSITGGVNHILAGYEISYTGANQTTQPDAAYQNATTSSGLTTSFSQTTTPCGDNSWLVWSGQDDVGGGVTANTNITLRHNDAAALWMGDNNGAITPPAATTQTVTATSRNFLAIQISIREASATCSPATPAVAETIRRLINTGKIIINNGSTIIQPY